MEAKQILRRLLDGDGQPGFDLPGETGPSKLRLQPDDPAEIGSINVTFSASEIAVLLDLIRAAQLGYSNNSLEVDFDSHADAIEAKLVAASSRLA